MCYEEIACPRCASLHVKKNGTTANRKQKYQCTDCRRQFITDYTYRGCQSFIRALVVPMTMNPGGIRDIARALSISTQAVMKTIRASAAGIREPRVPPRIKDLGVDESWSFVKDKSRQCRCWYGLDRSTTRIAAYVLGRRTDRSCRQLCEELSGCVVENFYPDDWQSYAKALPAERRTISKAETLDIERHNLNFRTHLKRLHRRTICFSKSDEMHAAAIELYVNHVNAYQHKL